MLALPVRERHVRRFTSADFRREDAPLLPSGVPATLRDVQLDALSELAECRGGYFPIDVGEGKTLVSFLGGRVLGCRRTILIVPSSLRGKTSQDHATWSRYFQLSEGLRIIGSAEVQIMSGTHILEQLVRGFRDEEVFVFVDEAHEFKNFTAARTKRLMWFAAAHPRIAFACASGTPTKRKVSEFAHLAELCLRERSPVPRDKGHLAAWGQCIDVSGRPGDSDWHVVDPLARWAGESLQGTTAEKQTAARRAFQRRFSTAPGVVRSLIATPVGAALRIHWEVPAVPAEVVEALRKVQAGQSLAGPDVYASDALQAMDERRVSLGFYYVWNWAKVGRTHPDHEWLQARKAWHAEARGELERRAEQEYDSEAWIAQACESGKAPPALAAAWFRWKAVRERYDVDKMRESRWISRYLVDKAVAWFHKQPGFCILWYQDKAVEQVLREVGLEVRGAGSQIDEERPEKIAAAIKVHGTGRNLQRWSRMAYLGVSASGELWHQSLARLHRPGQLADVVSATVYVPTQSVLDAIDKAFLDAKYARDTLQTPHKLLLADFESELPRRASLP